jgi:cytochrome c
MLLRKILIASVSLAVAAAAPFMPKVNAHQRSRSTAKAAPKPAADAKTIAEGKKIFKENCAICHFTDTTEKKLGPGLQGLWKRGEFADGKKIDEESLRSYIAKGGKTMPGFADKLNKDEIRAVVAYLKTL